jgi:transposase-like protein
MANELQNKVFHDEHKARKWLEGHLWADGPVCSHCRTVNNATALDTRPGVYQCNESACRKQFTVMTGTLFERSHIPLNKWLMAAFLICASKKGMSAHQMHRMLGVSYKSTWFMMHRIREAMREGKFPGPLGGEGKIVEADETHIGGKERTSMSTNAISATLVEWVRKPHLLWSSVVARSDHSMCRKSAARRCAQS